MILLVGSDKGLLEYSLSSDHFEFKNIHFEGYKIGAIHSHRPSGKWRVAINHKHWGSKIHESSDGGNNWIELPYPVFSNETINIQGNKPSLKSIWTIYADPNEDAETFYIGTEPAALFKTNNNGKTYELNNSLWNHPSREMWMGGGKGSTQPFLHSIQKVPNRESHLVVGISAGGVFESRDYGETWSSINKGVKTDFLPDFNIEAGHDPHTIRISKSNPNVFWQQNHCGIYRSTDGGKKWSNVSGEDGKPHYGFGMVIDEKDDQKAWVIPAQSDDVRLPFDYQLSVFYTDNGGEQWKVQNVGLPQPPNFDLVFRQAFEKKEEYLVFGTNNGNLFYSMDEGHHWNSISQNLAPIRCLEVLDDK